MTNDPLPDIWHARDLPILRESARLLEEAPFGQGVRIRALAEAAGLEIDPAMRAVRALEDAGLLTVRWTMPASGARVSTVSPRAKHLVGHWPSEEVALDRIVQALERIADNADNPANQEAAQALDAFQRAGHAFQSVAEAALTGEMP